LTDLIFINENYKIFDKKFNHHEDDVYVNFDLLKKISKILNDIKLYQSISFKFNPVNLFNNYFKNFVVLNEKSIYDLSLKCEPKKKL
jgi:hypothetical protein